MHDSFCVFILSHGRPDNIITLKTLKKCGYSGEWRIVIDDEDDTAWKYFEEFGENVVQFSKQAIAERFDQMDGSDERRTIFYARNACFDIAMECGFKYFLELDDDYTSFEYRYEENGKLKVDKIKDIDETFEAYLDFLDESGAVTVAMAQGGDLIGGKDSKNFQRRVLRKTMNSFFCRTDRRFGFIGRINEDVNTYVLEGSRGKLFLTAVDATLVQKRTQENSGGMTDVYMDNGTYVKSFYTVIAAPSCVTVEGMGDKHWRMHHKVKWDDAVPKIISEEYRKA